MAKQEIVLTAEGLKKVTAEIDELKSEARPRVADRIREAKQFGDIAENAEYEAAKAEQSLIEGRIETLQSILQNAVISEGPGKDGRVSVGSVVRLREATGGEETEYHIVGALEADPAENRISIAGEKRRGLTEKGMKLAEALANKAVAEIDRVIADEMLSTL